MYQIFEVANGSKESDLQLKGLNPNFKYGVKLQFLTEYGKGPSSQEILISTLPTTRPNEVKQTSYMSPNSVQVSWERPLRIAENVSIVKFEWQLCSDDTGRFHVHLSNFPFATSFYSKI